MSVDTVEDIEVTEAPVWLTQEFFSDIIQSEYPDGKIVKLTLQPANSKGENFSSTMLRAELIISFEDQDIRRNFIVKIGPIGMTQEIMDQFNVFPKEIEMYERILPELQKICERVDENIKLSPRCLRATCDPVKLIIMEDLRASGFKTADRRTGLDQVHIEMTLEKLAKLHASSAVYYEQVKSFSQHFDYGLYADHMKPLLYEVYGRNIEMMREVSSSWKCHRSMGRFLDNYQAAMLDRVYALVDQYRREPNRFRVLCHGDLWCNNVLFKYNDSGEPIDCLLLDFQLSNFNVPAFDLNYFLFTSARQDLKLSHLDHFIHHYHSHLEGNLIRLEYAKPIPTLFELQKEFLELGAYGLSAAYGTLCAVVAPAGKAADMNNLLGDDEESQSIRRALFGNPLYMDALDQLIPYFERKGVF